MLKHNKIHLSLKSTLWLSICAIVLSVLVLMTSVSYILISNTIHSKTESSLQREIGLIQHNLATLTNNLDDFAVAFSVNRELQGILKENPASPLTTAASYNVNYALSRIFANLSGSSYEFASIEVFFSDDHIANIGRYTAQSMLDAFDNNAIDKTKETRHPVWSGPITLTNRMGFKEEVYAIYKAVYDLDSPDYLGCILLHIPVDRVNNIFEIASSDNVHFYLVQDSRIVSSNSVPESILASDILQFRNAHELELDDWLLLKQPADVNGWDILGSIPISYMAAEVRYLSLTMVITSIISIFAVLLISVILSHSVMKPVQNLMLSVEKLPLEDNLQFPLQEYSEIDNRFTSQDLDLMVSKIHKLVEQIYLSQKLRNTLQFQVMQSQIKPHFLYNALEIASSMVSLEMYPEAINYIQSLSTFYRLSLSSGNDIISLDNEIKLTKCYLDIQQHRYHEFFHYSVSVDRSYNDFMVPKLLLQPIVENAIYHGCKGKPSMCHITLSVTTDRNRVILTVSDDGVGMDQKQIYQILHPPKHSGQLQSYGLSNVAERLRIIYGKEAQLSVESELGKYTSVQLTLPGGNSE